MVQLTRPCHLYLAVFLLLGSAASAFADIPIKDDPSAPFVPRGPEREEIIEPRPAKTVLRVERSPDAEWATLRVPDYFLTTKLPPAEATSSFDPIRTVVVGLALSAACVGMLWVVRSKRLPRGASVSILGLVITGGLAGVVWANAAPPPRPTPPWQTEVGQVVVEMGDQAGEIVLVLNDQHLAELQKAIEELRDEERRPVSE